MASDPFLLHSDDIDRAIAVVCRRHGLFGQDAEDFASDVRLYLLDRDRAVLRAFEGRSSITTYLAAVVAHRLQDWRNARWGKWRPSVEARRLGPLAVHLETLVVRDGLTLDAAHELLRSRDGITESMADLEAMVARLPRRVVRTQMSDESLEEHAAAEASADLPLEEMRAGTLGMRAADVLRTVIRKLPADDRLLLRMRFDDAIRVSDISRMLAVDQKALYRRFDRLLVEIRRALEDAGITSADAQEILAHGGFDRLPTGPFSELHA